MSSTVRVPTQIVTTRGKAQAQRFGKLKRNKVVKRCDEKTTQSLPNANGPARDAATSPRDDRLRTASSSGKRAGGTRTIVRSAKFKSRSYAPQGPIGGPLLAGPRAAPPRARHRRSVSGSVPLHVAPTGSAAIHPENHNRARTIFLKKAEWGSRGSFVHDQLRCLETRREGLCERVGVVLRRRFPPLHLGIGHWCLAKETMVRDRGVER